MNFLSQCRRLITSFLITVSLTYQVFSSESVIDNGAGLDLGPLIAILVNLQSQFPDFAALRDRIGESSDLASTRDLNPKTVFGRIHGVQAAIGTPSDPSTTTTTLFGVLAAIQAGMTASGGTNLTTIVQLLGTPPTASGSPQNIFAALTLMAGELHHLHTLMDRVHSIEHQLGRMIHLISHHEERQEQLLQELLERVGHRHHHHH